MTFLLDFGNENKIIYCEILSKYIATACNYKIEVETGLCFMALLWIDARVVMTSLLV